MVAVAVVFDGGSSVQWHSMASVMDSDKRTRGRHKERQCNNKPARQDDERAVRGATRGQGKAMRQQLVQQDDKMVVQ
jgi:hypothetical protein